MDGFHVRTGLNGAWDSEIADCLLQVLLDFSSTVDLSDDFEAQMVIPDIRSTLKGAIRCNYSLDDVIEQFARVQERFVVFKWILGQPGVVYDNTSNRMFVPPEVRSNAKYNCPKASKYFYYGDDRWDMLKRIFADKTDVANTQSVVVSNQNIQGSHDNPITISDSGPSSWASISLRANANPYDVGSAVSDVSSWEDINRRIRMRRHRPSKSSTEMSTAGSRPANT